MLRWSLFAWVLVLSGCAADEAREPAELAELCGVPGPVRLLALDRDRELWSGIRRFGDRYVILTRAQTADPDAPEENELWSVGLCGESPRRLAADVSRIFEVEPWPGVLLGCREQANDIVSLDPAGIEPPHVVFADIGCYPRVTRHGLVTSGIGAEPAPLKLYPYPDDPRSETSGPIVLVDMAPVLDPTVVRLSDIVVLDDRVFFLDENNDLLRVELADGAVTVEQTDVRDFDVDRFGEGRYLLWQDIQQTNGDLERPDGLIFFRDRTTGEGMSLTDTWLAYSPFPLLRAEQGYMELVLGNGRTRVYSLPGFGFTDLPRNRFLKGRLADGRWLVQGWSGGTLYITGLDDLTALTALWVDGAILQITAEAALIHDVVGSCVGDCRADEGAVWSVPFDGSRPRRVSEALAPSPRALDERRLLAIVDRDAERVGELVLVDLETRREQRIDTQVLQGLFNTALKLGEDIYAYQVDDGERSGMWAVRVPPAP